MTAPGAEPEGIPTPPAPEPEPAPEPAVSVLVPVLDEEDWIEEVIGRLQAQTTASVEIIVADGRSTDRTRAIVAALAAGDPRVRLVDNPGRAQSAGLNRALGASRAPVVVRLDGHAMVEADYVERCAALLETTGADVVGGRMVARRTTDRGATAEAIELVNGRWWGAGPAAFHHEGRPGFVDTVYLGCFRREALDAAGGWSEEVGVNEDYELNYRIRRGGGRVYYDPALRVSYVPRHTMTALARQYFRYGSSKAATLRRHPGSLRPRQAAPAGLGLVAIAGLAGGRPGRAARAALVAHAALIASCAGRERSVAGHVRTRAAAAAMLMHWCWAAGFWAGLVPRRAGNGCETGP